MSNHVQECNNPSYAIGDWLYYRILVDQANPFALNLTGVQLIDSLGTPGIEIDVTSDTRRIIYWKYNTKCIRFIFS